MAIYVRSILTISTVNITGFCHNSSGFNFLKAWTTLIDLYFYSNILVLWALNFGFWTVAIYIIGMVTFGQYHISKKFKFLLYFWFLINSSYSVYEKRYISKNNKVAKSK